MNVIVIKYMQLFCITVFFTNNVNCDQLQLQLQSDKEDQQLYVIATCVYNCLKDDTDNLMNMEGCYKNCTTTIGPSNKTSELKNVERNLLIKFLCRDDTSIVLNITNEINGGWINGNIINNDETSTDDSEIFQQENTDNIKLNRQLRRSVEMPFYDENKKEIKKKKLTNKSEENFIYLVKVQEEDEPFGERTFYMTNSSIIKVENLTANTNYNFSVTILNGNYEYSYGQNGVVQFNTLEHNYTPGEIKNITIVEYKLNLNKNKNLDAFIVWEPADDMTCKNEIFWYSKDEPTGIVGPITIAKPEALHKFTVRYLKFGMEYCIFVLGKNTKNPTKESQSTCKNVTVPSCLQWYENDGNMCAPLEAKNIQVTETCLTTNNYSVNISWDLPELIPNYYIVKIMDLNLNGRSFSLNVTGNSTEITFQSIELFSVQYDVMIIAITNGGNSTAGLLKTIDKNQLIPADNLRIFKIIMAVIAPIIILVIIFLIVILICHRRAKLKRYEERCRYFEELEQKAPIDPNSNFDYKSKNLNLSLQQLAQLQMEMDCSMFANDIMEVSRDNVKIMEILGEGAFGLVKKGLLKTNDGTEKEIAVKMFKDRPSAEDFKEFRREIEVMKSVGEHQNIVCILGHCTKNIQEMMLLTEFCCYGNLLNYLRSEWQFISENQQTALMDNNSCNTPALMKQKTPENVFNFDTSFVEKTSFRYKNLNDDNQKTYETNIDDMISDTNLQQLNDNNVDNFINSTNLIINKLYDEYGTKNLNNKKIHSDDENMICTNSCKCNVEIIKVEIKNKCNCDNNLTESNYTEINNDDIIDNENIVNYVDDDDVNIDDDHDNNISDIIKNGVCSQHTDDDINNINNLKEINRKCKIKINDCECYRKKCDDNNIIIVNNNNLINNNNNNSNKNNNNNINNNNTLIVENPTYNELIKNEQNNIKKQINYCDSDSIKINKFTKDIHILTCQDLLSFAKQISCGMDFLSKNKVVHRDLAARNVLVCANKTVKIADFGLSRDIYQENMYKKTGNGKLPIKWLALESMTHQVYTSQSDVWSYGILLYEIVTLGGNPYPSIPTNRLLKLLKTGYRMDKPKNCSTELYNLMFSCWNTNPHSRPTFNEICEKFGQFIDAEKCDYINFDLTVDNAKRIKSAGDDSYLKPI